MEEGKCAHLEKKEERARKNVVYSPGKILFFSKEMMFSLGKMVYYFRNSLWIWEFPLILSQNVNLHCASLH